MYGTLIDKSEIYVSVSVLAERAILRDCWEPTPVLGQTVKFKTTGRGPHRLRSLPLGEELTTSLQCGRRLLHGHACFSRSAETGCTFARLSRPDLSPASFSSFSRFSC